jgi:hypothetical protein
MHSDFLVSSKRGHTRRLFFHDGNDVNEGTSLNTQEKKKETIKILCACLYPEPGILPDGESLLSCDHPLQKTRFFQFPFQYAR